MEDKLFVQCLLTKGNVRQVAWIPVRGAVAGRTIELKSGPEEDRKGWLVKETWGMVTKDFLDLHHSKLGHLPSVEAMA